MRIQQLCSVNTPISLNLSFNKCLVKQFAFLAIQIHLNTNKAKMSSYNSVAF